LYGRLSFLSTGVYRVLAYQKLQLQTPHLPAESNGIFFKTALIEKLD
jgi:hypothetical protein